MTTFIVLFVLLRSVVLPVKALVMNTLSIVASFGALVWIFQDGNLSAAARVPAARVRRDHPAGDPVLRPVRAVDGLRGVPAVADEGGLGPDAATTPRRSPAGLERSGRIVTSAALIVVVVAGLVRVRRHRADQGARASASRSPSRSTRPSSARCSCPRRCGCSGTGTGGCPARLDRALGRILPRTEAEAEAAAR